MKYLHYFTGLTHSDNSVDPLVVPSRLYFRAPTSWWNPLGLRSLWFSMAHLPRSPDIQASPRQSSRVACHRGRDNHRSGDMRWKRASLDSY